MLFISCLSWALIRLIVCFIFCLVVLDSFSDFFWEIFIFLTLLFPGGSGVFFLTFFPLPVLPHSSDDDDDVGVGCDDDEEGGGVDCDDDDSEGGVISGDVDDDDGGDDGANDDGGGGGEDDNGGGSGSDADDNGDDGSTWSGDGR